jgi:hypothetical protein
MYHCHCAVSHILKQTHLLIRTLIQLISREDRINSAALWQLWQLRVAVPARGDRLLLVECENREHPRDTVTF